MDWLDDKVGLSQEMAAEVEIGFCWYLVYIPITYTPKTNMEYKNDRKSGQHISSIPNLHLWIPAVSRPRKTYGHLNSMLNRFYEPTLHFNIFQLYHKVATFYLFPRLSTCETLRFQIGRLCVQGLSAPVLLAFVFYLQTLKLGGKTLGWLHVVVGQPGYDQEN